MNRLPYVQIAIVAAIFALPYAVLGALGFAWLYEHHSWFWPWIVFALIFTAAPSLAVWLWSRKLKQKKGQQYLEEVDPSPNWVPRGRTAWDEVEAIAQRAKTMDLDPQKPEAIWEIFKETVGTVAKRFHPESDQPLLETPVPHLLRVVELASRDLRRATGDHVPGAHLLTLNDFMRAKRLFDFGGKMYLIYRVASFAMNPLSAALRELQAQGTGRMMDASVDHIKSWAIEYAVKKTGYYAIELYSGNLILDDVNVEARVTDETKADINESQQRDQKLSGEPLRILVIGQVKAGKSSLINAVFRETKAAVDIVPRTRGVEAHYIAGREGLPEAILLDTAGYEDVTQTRNVLNEAREEIEQADVVLMVSSATSAARAADAKLLDGVRAFFAANPNRESPPVVVALTHVDQLRPIREWNPPYDVVNPKNPKAQNIRDAMNAVAEDLEVDPSQVVPVCLAPDRIDNVDQALIPAILTRLPEAKRVRYLRCLKDYHDEQYWSRLWQQATNSGRLLARIGAHFGGDAFRNLDRLVRKLPLDRSGKKN
ncbi:MAG TPA: GTPase [Pirellulales bacterium]